jgi:hypothetical protein
MNSTQTESNGEHTHTNQINGKWKPPHTIQSKIDQMKRGTLI